MVPLMQQYYCLNFKTKQMNIDSFLEKLNKTPQEITFSETIGN
jgi:hypothetical protein